MTSWLGARHCTSPCCKLSGIMVVKIKHFWFVYDLRRPCVVLIYAWKLLIVYHPLPTFNGQTPCGIRDIKYLTSHVTLQKHVITSFYVTNLSNLVVHGHCGSGGITYFVCHVTLQGHVNKGSCEFKEEATHCKWQYYQFLCSWSL